VSHPAVRRPVGVIAAAVAAVAVSLTVASTGAVPATAPKRVLTVAKMGDGSIRSGDDRIACGPRCKRAYAPGSVVTLTATPGRYHKFDSWTAGCAGSAPYRLSGLRGKELTVTSTLVSVRKDGSLGSVVRKEDRVEAAIFQSADCSETGGNDVFVTYVTPNVRYRVILELYRDPELKDRIALTQTDVFVG
jgi:hypothetical protein